MVPLHNDPEVEARIRLNVGEVFLTLTDVRRAKAELRRALRLSRSASKESKLTANIEMTLVMTIIHQANLSERLLEMNEAKELAANSVKTFDRLGRTNLGTLNMRLLPG